MSLDRNTLNQLRIDRPAAETRRRPGRLLIGIMLLVALGAAGAWLFVRPRAVIVRAITVPPPVEPGEKVILNASGYVTARREATISSKITGKVAEVRVEEGMKVEVGQILATLDAANVERNLQFAQAELESARKTLGETQANLDQARREVARLEKLREERIATALEFERAEAEAKALSARLDRQMADIAVADRRVGMLKQDLDDTTIRAPFSGVVTSKNAQPGEMISPMSSGGFTRTGICTIVDMSSLEIEVDVSESYIQRVEANMLVEAKLDAYPNWRIAGKVIAVIPTADRQKATVKVRVGFARLDPRILPDMSVKVAFLDGLAAAQPATTPVATTHAAGMITIPRSAVRWRDGRNLVFVVRDGKAEQRTVTVAEATEAGEAQIAAGLSAGERIVIEGPADLAPGQAVTLKPAP